MKLKPILSAILSEAIDTGSRTFGGSHLNREQTVFNIDNVKDVCDELNSKINAIYVNSKYSTLGGARNVSILMSISLDPKDEWANGIYNNSRFMKFHIHQDGVVEQFVKSYEIEERFRKFRGKDINDIINRINKYIESIK